MPVQPSSELPPRARLFGCRQATTLRTVNKVPNALPRDRHIPDLIPLVEAAEMLRMSRQALRKAAMAGQILGANIRNDSGRRVWVFRRLVIEREAASPAGLARIERWRARHGEPEQG